MGRVGVFGGTFNPVHLGHEYIVREVAAAVELDRIIIMPSKIPPHKQASELANEQDRLAMCEIAFGKVDKVQVSDYEFTREGKSYSFYTISYLKDKYPDDELCFIMGSDMLLSFHEWFRYEDILKMCSIICISRADEDSSKLEDYAKKLSEIGQVKIVHVKPMEISSTHIRERLKKHEDCSCYLNENVVQYIMDKNLF